MRIAVIGGSGHIGSFLIPLLIRSGHQVLNLSRGTSRPYVRDEAWSDVSPITVDRDAEDLDGTFGPRVAALHADVVVDLICFTPASATALVEALRGETGHLIHCGSIWRYGVSHKPPMREDDSSPPFGEYGIQRPRSRRFWLPRPDPVGSSPPYCNPGTSAAPGGCRSARWATTTPESGTPSRPGKR